MSRAKFFRLKTGDYNELRKFAVILCADIFRNSEPGSKIIILTNSDEEAKIVSTMLWKSDGFIPSTLIGAKDENITPIVIGTKLVSKCNVFINLQLNKNSYSNEELNTELIVDFTADEIIDCIECCRSRYRQLSNNNIQIDYQIK